MDRFNNIGGLAKWAWVCSSFVLLAMAGGAAQAQSVTNGQTLYVARCQTCHGAGATNATDSNYGKVGNAGKASTASDITLLTSACQNNNKMPCGSPALTAANIADLVAFIQSKNGTLPAAAPMASLSASSITFGSQVVNSTSASQQVTLTNTGTAALNITGIALAGSNATDFAGPSGTCATGALNAGANCTIAATFTPTASGTRSATITVTHNSNNAVGSTSVVTLSGTGATVATSAISVSPTSLSFGTTALNTQAAAQTVTITNSGQATLNLSAISVTGTNATDFPLTNACGASVAVGANCKVTVGFAPTQTGTRSASLSISSNASNAATLNVGLSGTAVTSIAPAMSANVASLSFGNQPVGAASVPMTVTISNTGNATLSVTSVTSSNTAFGVTNPCTNIAAGATCDVSVSFTPPATGAASGTVTINGAAVSPVTVALSGTGVTSTVGGGTGSATGDAINGQKLYQSNCATCHMADPLNGVSKVGNGIDASRIQWAITNNRGGMAGLSFLTAQNLNDIATYIGSRTSQKPTLIQTASGTPTSAAPSAPATNLGGGGCSVAQGDQRDLSLLVLLVVSLSVLGLRRLRVLRSRPAH